MSSPPTTWNLWDEQLLSSASLPNTGRNRLFMDQWHAHASSNCRYNPVDISRSYRNSTNCEQLPGTTRHAQRFTGTADPQFAFQQQIHAAPFHHLLTALQGGDPYTVPSATDVRDDLKAWGSPQFAAFYLAEVNAAQAPVPLKAPQALGGWKDLQRTVNHHMPDTLRESARNRVRALRQIARARKVLR